jgi:L-iditol 2-dehydrogenase
VIVGEGVMRAALLYGPEDLRLEERTLPALAPGEVLLRITRALTCGTDLKMWRWGRHRALGPLPSLFGHEMAGVVAATGPGVEGFTPGMRVVAANSAPCFACYYCRRGRYSLCQDLLFLFGAFADHMVVPARIAAHNLHPIPDNVSDEAAAITEPLADVLHGIAVAGIEPNDTVAVLGGGALGLMLVRAAALQGARVVAIDRHAERLAIAEAFGAVATVDATQGTALEAVRGLTEGRGADVVIEAVGTVAAWEEAVGLAAPGATVVFFGGCASGTELAVDTYRLHYEELTLKGVFHHYPRFIAGALALLARGDLDTGRLISGTLPLGGLLEAFQAMGERKGIKYAIDPGAG